MADKKVSELSSITTLSGDDLLLVVNDPSGTPSSRKVTISDTFGNIQVPTVSWQKLTVNANTAFRGTVMTVSSNVIVSSSLSVNNFNVEARFDGVDTSLDDKMQVANTINLVDDRMQVANTIALANKYLEVANAASYLTTAVTNQYLEVANANVLFADRMQVSNAYALYYALDGGKVSNTQYQTDLANTNAWIANTVQILTNAGDVLNSDKVITANVVFTGTTSGNIVPTSDSTDSLGSPTKRFSELYLSGNTVYIDQAQIGYNAGNLTISNADLVVNGAAEINGLTSLQGLVQVDGVVTLNAALGMTPLSSPPSLAGQQVGFASCDGSGWDVGSDGQVHIVGTVDGGFNWTVIL
jgi:hypothetical protein